MTITLNPPVTVTSVVSMVNIDNLNILTEMFSVNPLSTDVVAEVSYTWLSNSPINNLIKTNSMRITRAQLATICSATGVNIDNLIANLNTIIVAFAQQTGQL